MLVRVIIYLAQYRMVLPLQGVELGINLSKVGDERAKATYCTPVVKLLLKMPFF
jgi:hypothetical protein